MNEKLVIILPLLAALGLLLWFLRWAQLHRQSEPALPKQQPRTPFLTRRDHGILWLITGLYALVAFVGLGSTKAPESFLHFQDANYYAVIELEEPVELSRLSYYCGMNTADYRLDLSLDGENWTLQARDDGSAAMTQSYTQLFCWNDAALNSYSGYTKYIRITAGAEMELGEIALYDAHGKLIPAEQLHPAAGCEALVDEQDCVPETISYQNGTYFDEIYHARTAYEHIREVWPYEITHPPLGKLILSLGIRLFGMNPFGWRFSGTLMGILMLPALYIFLKKLFGSTAVSACGTVIFAADFMHYTQTRIATIDSYVVFFILLMYLFMYLWLTEPEGKRRLLWLALTGLSFGCGIASKWTGFYAGAGLALLWLIHWIGRLRTKEAGVWKAWGKNAAWCCLFFLAVPGLIYYLSYCAYAPSQGIEHIFSREYLRMVLDNQRYMWNYHSGLVAEHPYASQWYQWLLDARPILYYLDYFENGSKSAFGAFNNPLLSWGGLSAVIAVLVLGLREKDKKALFIALGYLVNLLPWVGVSRLTFAYHYFPCTVFLVLALCWLFDDLRRRDPRWRGAIYSYTAACVALFVMFYPVISGIPCSENYCTYFLRWFPSWPF